LFVPVDASNTRAPGDAGFAVDDLMIQRRAERRDLIAALLRAWRLWREGVEGEADGAQGKERPQLAET
jgi:hypothetical protein